MKLVYNDLSRFSEYLRSQGNALWLHASVAAISTGMFDADIVARYHVLIIGDDSDTFAVIMEPTLLPITHVEAANYESAGTREIDRNSDINDVCDFVVEYINSDVLASTSATLPPDTLLMNGTGPSFGSALNHRR